MPIETARIAPHHSLCGRARRELLSMVSGKERGTLWHCTQRLYKIDALTAAAELCCFTESKRPPSAAAGFLPPALTFNQAPFCPAPHAGDALLQPLQRGRRCYLSHETLTSHSPAAGKTGALKWDVWSQTPGSVTLLWKARLDICKTKWKTLYLKLNSIYFTCSDLVCIYCRLHLSKNVN